MRAILLLLLCALPLGACSFLDTDVERGYAVGHSWTPGSVFTTADVRIITQRKHPKLGNEVVCAEPSPDVAKALSTAASATAQGGNGAANGSLGASGASAEALAELAGRSTALLGLRDSLFRTCEAYANGAIGQDAYALVVARYTQLMTTLFLSQDITGAAGAEGKAAIASNVVQALVAAPASQNGGSPAPSTTTTTTTPTPTPAKVKASTVGVAPGASLMAATYFPSGDHPDAAPEFVRITDKSVGGTSTDAATGADAAGSNTTTPATGQTTTTTGAVSATAALALVRMNEDYMNQNILSAIAINCINEYDPTRFSQAVDDHSTPQPVNNWLAKICTALDYDELKALLEYQQKYLKLVNPEVAAQTTAVTTPPTPKSTTKPVDPTILALQKALTKAGCAGCKVTADGVFGKNTKSAIEAYQNSQNLTPNGDPKDAATLQKLGIAAAPAPRKAVGAAT